jgi:hypothetical protein
MADSHEHRAVVNFFFPFGKTAEETVVMLQRAYRESELAVVVTLG